MIELFAVSFEQFPFRLFFLIDDRLLVQHRGSRGQIYIEPVCCLTNRPVQALAIPYDLFSILFHLRACGFWSLPAWLER